MYLGPPCYGYALNCRLVYFAIHGTRPSCMKKQNYFVFLYATAKSEIQICSNKHETGLVYDHQNISKVIRVIEPTGFPL